MTDACKSITVVYRVHVHHVTSTEKRNTHTPTGGEGKMEKFGLLLRAEKRSGPMGVKSQNFRGCWWKGVQTEQRDSRETAETGLYGEGSANSEKSA